MKINAQLFGIAGALAAGIYFTAGFILLVLFPEQSLRSMASLFLLSSFGPLTNYFDISFSTFITGLISYVIYTYIFTYLLARIYNKLIDNAKM